LVIDAPGAHRVESLPNSHAIAGAEQDVETHRVGEFRPMTEPTVVFVETLNEPAHTFGDELRRRLFSRARLSCRRLFDGTSDFRRVRGHYLATHAVRLPYRLQHFWKARQAVAIGGR